MCCYRLLGRIDVRPALSTAEHEYLLAFAESRRWQRPAGPYAVPGNPAAECLSARPDSDRWSTPADGQPGLYCPWRPADDGGALVPHTDPDAVTSTPAGEVAAWLRYLCTHFLGPDPAAARDPHYVHGGGPEGGHRMNGVAVVADDGGDLRLVRASGTRISLERLTAAPDPARDR